MEMARNRKEPLEVFFDYILNIPEVFALLETKIFFEFGHAVRLAYHYRIILTLLVACAT